MLALLVLLVVGATAQPAHPGATHPPPKPCCASNTFTAKTAIQSSFMSNGVGVTEQSTTRILFDYDHKMLFVEISTTDVVTMATTDNKIIQDYNNMKQYIMNNDGSCWVQNWMGDMRQPCIPANATFLGEVTMGSGHNSVVGDAWQFDTMGQAMTKMVVDKENCTPLIESAVGTIQQKEQAQVTTFFDYMPMISADDRLMMVVPTNCTDITPTTGPVVG